MEHPDSAAAENARAAIASQRQRVLAWMDADRIVPADGSSLLAALEQAQEGLTGASPGAARRGIEAFVGRVEALIDAADGRLPLDPARGLLAGLPGERPLCRRGFIVRTACPCRVLAMRDLPESRLQHRQHIRP